MNSKQVVEQIRSLGGTVQICPRTRRLRIIGPALIREAAEAATANSDDVRDFLVAEERGFLRHPEGSQLYRLGMNLSKYLDGRTFVANEEGVDFYKSHELRERAEEIAQLISQSDTCQMGSELRELLTYFKLLTQVYRLGYSPSDWCMMDWPTELIDAREFLGDQTAATATQSVKKSEKKRKYYPGELESTDDLQYD